MRNVVLILALFVARFCFATASFEVKYNYANQFHQAFITQSLGQSTKAFYTFQNAFMEAQRVGENPAKLQAILEHFMWYRFYGQGSNLFAIQPEGSDRITGTYPFSANESTNDDAEPFEDIVTMCRYGSYQSNTPSVLAEIPDYGRYSPREIAELQTEFMLAEGMVIAGLILSFAGYPAYGVPLCIQGAATAYLSGRKLYNHKKALQEMSRTLENLKTAAAMQ